MKKIPVGIEDFKEIMIVIAIILIKLNLLLTF